MYLLIYFNNYYPLYSVTNKIKYITNNFYLYLIYLINYFKLNYLNYY